MAPRPVTDDQCRAAYAAVEAARGVARYAAYDLRIPETTLRRRYTEALQRFSLPPVTVTVDEPAAGVQQDRAKAKAASEQADLKKKYAEALQTIERQERELEALETVGRQGIETTTIEPRRKDSVSEATVCVAASDWHIEEIVDPRVVSGLNEYNLSIAKTRATKFFQSTLRLTQLLQQDIRIDHMILALLGDFISGAIHEEVAESAEIAPMHAIVEAQNMLASGIEFLLNHTKCRILVPCHSGNHGRVTKTTRFAHENGHSLEFLMYQHLAAYFRHEPRVQFLIAEGYHSYVQVYDQTLRFHHGHMVRYAGGVGGLYIPVNKAVAQWSKARRADLDVFGHFHQYRDGGNFICNGSMVGYNAFALSIKADYEEPKQALFLIDKRRGRTANWPILFR